MIISNYDNLITETPPFTRPSDIELPDFASDEEYEDGEHNPEKYATWTETPERNRKLLAQVEGGSALVKATFGIPDPEPNIFDTSIHESERFNSEPRTATPDPDAWYLTQSQGDVATTSHNVEAPAQSQTRSADSSLDKGASEEAQVRNPKSGLAAPPKRAKLPRKATEADRIYPKEINLKNTGFGKNPRRPKPGKMTPAEVKEKIELSYRMWYPAISSLLDYRPLVRVVGYSIFFPYRLNPNKASILTKGKVALLDAAVEDIFTRIRYQLRDSQDRTFVPGFGLGSLIANSGETVEDLMGNLDAQMSLNEGLGKFIGFSILRSYQHIATKEQVSVRSNYKRTHFDYVWFLKLRKKHTKYFANSTVYLCLHGLCRRLGRAFNGRQLAVIALLCKFIIPRKQQAS